jgi:hypothetical protein
MLCSGNVHEAVDGSTDKQQQCHPDGLLLSAKPLKLLGKILAHAT